MRRIVLVLAAVALVGGACSSGDKGGGGGACTEANAVDLSGDNPFTVTVHGFAFIPNCFKASSTSAITIVNQDAKPHTFTIDGTQVNAPLPPGETFNGESAGLAAGTYPFKCTIHPTMTGTIIVV